MHARLVTISVALWVAAPLCGVCCAAFPAVAVWPFPSGAAFARPDAIGALFLFPLALVPLALAGASHAAATSAGARDRTDWGYALACLATFCVDPVLLAFVVSGAVLVAARPSRGGGDVAAPALLLGAACLWRSDWLICGALLLCVSGGGTKRVDRSHLLVMSLALLVASRSVLQHAEPLAAGPTALLMAGALVVGAWRAVRALACRTLSEALLSLASIVFAFMLVAAALAAQARAADMALSASTAEKAFVLGLVTVWPAAAVLLALGDAVTARAGSDHLDRLGGLPLFAPRLASLFAGALFLVSFLPPSGAFSLLWLETEIVLESPAGDSLAAKTPFLLTLACFGALVGLAGLASARVATQTLLGGARTPRMAATQDVAWPEATPVLCGLGLTMAAALAPGVLFFAARPVLRAFSGGAGFTDQTQLLSLIAPDGLSRFTPLALFVCVVFAASLARIAKVRPARQSPMEDASGSRFGAAFLAERGSSQSAPWAGGMKTRASWLPFGEPRIWPSLSMQGDLARVLLWPGCGATWRRGLRRQARLLITGVRILSVRVSRVEDQGLAIALALAGLGLIIGALWG
ncbi:hypothetical protein [Acetobacter nitrogenifigens]|uniref:NADH:quinone oxidoreductase/Mrp antiporter membrane subunit domain-containing protein n=2 Tax=Acetobacter nitrogenifigens TaxID=285268 RepID=A0A511X646_9PROT|nr:hypothetical protein [Acetobacter nitrogenifigens]GEN58410.1 hypothetical protein ANI02nite_02940 [Acetobacter nitrogenifigens DSM 23921 = NBRC 105050]